MFSNLTLYYLNQIGIIPWINKENSSNSLPQLNSAESSVIKLVVLISSDLSDKAQSLFNRMMAYINIQHNELLMINIKQHDLADNTNRQWFSQIENKSPSPIAILSLGLNTNDLFAGLNLTYPILQSLALDHLLNNPSSKKKVFQDLSYLKKLV